MSDKQTKETKRITLKKKKKDSSHKKRRSIKSTALFDAAYDAKKKKEWKKKNWFLGYSTDVDLTNALFSVVCTFLFFFLLSSDYLVLHVSALSHKLLSPMLAIRCVHRIWERKNRQRREKQKKKRKCSSKGDVRDSEKKRWSENGAVKTAHPSHNKEEAIRI